MSSLRVALLLSIIFAVNLLTDAEKKNPHFCRQRPFAPKCRGGWAKRDFLKLEPLLEEPRTINYRNGESGNANELEKYDQRFYDTSFVKPDPRIPEEAMDDYN